MFDWNMCEDCRYLENEPDKKPCNNCINWDDGYKNFRNFERYESEKRFPVDKE